MMILQTQGQPLDLGLTLKAGQAFRWQSDGDDCWWVGVISGQLVRIRQQDVDGDLEFEGAPGPDGDVGELLHRYFRLDDPIAEIYQSISRNDVMAGLVGRYHGLRLLRQEPWECLVSYICSATNSVGRISESMENLSKRWGREVRLGDRVRHTFPTAMDLAGADEDELNREIKGIPILGSRVKAASQEVCDGNLDFTALSENLSGQDVVGELKTLNGVGDKISHCVALFSLDKLDAFPIDRHIARGLVQVMRTEMGFSGSRKQAQDYFGAYAGYAGQFIFHHYRTESG